MISIFPSLGIGSGLNTPQLVSDLAAAERGPRESAIRARSERAIARISALGQVRAGLDAFVGALAGLTGGGGLGLQPVSADPATVTVTRDLAAGAAPLDLQVEVLRLASAQTLTSARYADAGAPVGFGTLTIARGQVTASAGVVTGFAADPALPPVTITIGAGNDSLAGARDAINAAGAGVTASIIDDGQGARLVLKGASGDAGGFTLTAAPTSGSPAGLALANLAFEPASSSLTLASEALNARVSVDGVLIERASNILIDLVPGYRMELKRAAPGAPVALAARRDPALLRASMDDFVAAYNEMNSLLAELSRPGTRDASAGPLHGQSSVRALRAELARLSSRPLASGSTFVSLAEIGVRTARDGSLSLDGARLDAAITTDPALLEKLFASSQAVTTAAITIASPPGLAKPGQYEVTDLVPATQGRLDGAAAPTAFDFPLDIDAANQGFTAMLDGIGPLSLNIPAGSYATGASLAAAFEAAINSNPAIAAAGRGVSVGWSAGRFLFLSRLAGARSAVAITGLDATLAERTGLDGATPTAGTDVAGSIAGVIAIGNGTRLTASAASRASGLSLTVGSAAPASARVDVADGLAGAIGRIRDTLSRGDGGLAAAARRLDGEQSALVTEFTSMQTRSDAFTAGLTRQFGAMERAVASYRSVGSFLDQQIAAWFPSNRR